MIELSPYDSQWPVIFENTKNQVWPSVKEFSESIEHVGSTSVPGLWAKPIVDIAVVVETDWQSKEAILALEKLGYVHRGNLGIEGREAFKRPENSVKHNLYVVLKDSVSLKNHLTFKNYLLQNSQARERYSELKKTLVKKYNNDMDLYCDGKTSFIVGILKQQGLDSKALLEIELANQMPGSKIVELSVHHGPSIIKIAEELPQWFTKTGIENLKKDILFQKGLVFEHATKQVLGFVTYFVNQGIAQIGWMGTSIEFHRQKIGRKLLEQLETTLIQNGIEEVLVSTLGDSVDYEPYARTRSFYRLCGFEDYKKILHPENPECEEELILRKIYKSKFPMLNKRA